MPTKTPSSPTSVRSVAYIVRNGLTLPDTLISKFALTARANTATDANPPPAAPTVRGRASGPRLSDIAARNLRAGIPGDEQGGATPGCQAGCSLPRDGDAILRMPSAAPIPAPRS